MKAGNGFTHTCMSAPIEVLSQEISHFSLVYEHTDLQISSVLLLPFQRDTIEVIIWFPEECTILGV